MATMQTDGADDLADLFERLPEEMEGALRAAAQAGAAVVKDEVVLRAPRRRGILGDNIYQKHIPELATVTSHTYYVSWRKKGKGDGVPFYGAWVEYGHWYVPPKPNGITWKNHRSNKAVFVPAHPFLRPAFEARKGEALAEMEKTLKAKVAVILGQQR